MHAETRPLTARRIAAAVAFGLFLATLPFWPYLVALRAIEPHTDHAPRHGGQLAMVGDHHIEVVRRRGLVEVFVSDAQRRPVDAAGCWLVFDNTEKVALEPANDRWRAVDRPAAREIEATMLLVDGTRLAMEFDFSP